MMIAAVEPKAPMLVKASSLIDGFPAAVQKKNMSDLEPSMADPAASLIASEALFNAD